MKPTNRSPLEVIGTTVQIVSVVAGVVRSILNFNNTRLKEAEVRRVEAAKPFLELRQKFYLEGLHAAAILSNPDVHTDQECLDAEKRFKELYVAELSMVEVPEVEANMVELAKAIDPNLLQLKGAQLAAYNLAHAVRDSFVTQWGIPRK
jgi:hypothetical protein